MLQTQLIIHAPDRPGRTPEVTEFLLAVHRCRIDYNVIMDMVLIAECKLREHPVPKSGKSFILPHGKSVIRHFLLGMRPSLA